MEQIIPHGGGIFNMFILIVPTFSFKYTMIIRLLFRAGVSSQQRLSSERAFVNFGTVGRSGTFAPSLGTYFRCRRG
jgi:hypothetical protein